MDFGEHIAKQKFEIQTSSPSAKLVHFMAGMYFPIFSPLHDPDLFSSQWDSDLLKFDHIPTWCLYALLFFLEDICDSQHILFCQVESNLKIETDPGFAVRVTAFEI